MLVPQGPETWFKTPNSTCLESVPPAGEKYNKKNALHLKSQLRFRHMLGRSISLTDSLRKELERLIPTFAYVELAPEKMPSSEKTLTVLYETCKEVGPETGEDRAKYSNY